MAPCIRLTLPPVLALSAALSACGAPADTGEGQSEAGSLRPLSVSSDSRIVDDRDREVLLRGVNITSLGEYWQGSAAHPPTQATTDADWDAMAARGLQVVRLIVHWSLLEPERGQLDTDYLDQIEAYVEQAAAHGMYTVIDMHQDAYSAFIFTAADESCPEGAWPGKGWDGAPAWATITDGLSTCVTGDRNSAPAVIAAWNHFYDNTDGIRDRFVATWAAVAERFAHRPEVAGYDLINEPETSRPSLELMPIYDALLAELIAEIRATGSEQLIFLEPTLPAGDTSLGLLFPDPERMGVEAVNLVGATHNYAESIDVTGLTIEATNALLWAMAENQGTGLWIGEYGFWSTDEAVLEVAARYAADEDRYAQGGAWWQWRQPCGDPHSLERVDDAWQPIDTVIHLNSLDCIKDTELGPTEEFLTLLGRGYPRAAPGRIELLESDPDSGRLLLEASGGGVGETLEVWTPTPASSHEVWAEGLEDLSEEEVPGGRLIRARIADDADYSLGIVPL